MHDRAEFFRVAGNIALSHTQHDTGNYIVCVAMEK